MGETISFPSLRRSVSRTAAYFLAMYSREGRL